MMYDTNAKRLRWFISGGITAVVAGVTLFVLNDAVRWLWESVGGNDSDSSSLNISCFAYRDVNRNAVYDTRDRPYAGLRVEVDAPWGRTHTNSNIAGFANFTMALGDDEEPIDAPGRYDFLAVAPDGYSITSNNEAQTLSFSELQGSPAGIVATTTCIPIGVAPDLVITGSLGEVSEQNADTVTVTSERTSAPVTLRDDGHFHSPVQGGSWTVDIGGSKTRPRSVEVNNLPVYLTAPNRDRDVRQALQRLVVVDFDGFTPSDTLYEIPSGVVGLNWQNWVATHHKLYEGAGYVNATTSSEYIAYNSSGHPTSVWAEEPFDFVGMNLGVAWPEAEAFDIVLRGLRGDEVVYQDRLRASTAGARYVDSDYRSITRLEISSDAYWQFVVDDMRFRMP